MAAKTVKKAQKKTGWAVSAIEPPRLNDRQWVLSSVLGLVFILMALLQVISFADFRDNLEAADLPAPTVWAVCLILAELWAAAGFFKVKLSYLFRQVSMWLAVLVSGFWFVENIQLVSTGSALNNSGFFGRFLSQTPGWWTVIEVTLLLFFVLYAVEVAKDKEVAARA